MTYLKLTDSGTDYYQRQWASFLSQIISKCLQRWCGRDSITGLGTGISEVHCLPFSTFKEPPRLTIHLSSQDFGESGSLLRATDLASVFPSLGGMICSLPTGHACDSYQSNKQLQNGAEANVTKRVSFSQGCYFFFLLLATPCDMWAVSFLTRDRTHVHCSGRWNLNHWTAREVLGC